MAGAALSVACAAGVAKLKSAFQIDASFTAYPLREVLTVSSRGQITLPAEMRRQLGIEPGGAVIVEDFGGELRLKPAAVLEVELFSDEAIAEWDQADALTDQERQQILKRLQAC